MFDDFDILVMPTVPVKPFAAEADMPAEWPEDGVLPWIDWSPCTYPFNLAGNPAASVPVGFTPDGLPVGLQVVGPRFADARRAARRQCDRALRRNPAGNAGAGQPPADLTALQHLRRILRACHTRLSTETSEAMFSRLFCPVAIPRLAIDPATGTNKYLCPPGPGSGLICFSSCTASPMDWTGMARAALAFDTVMGPMSPALRDKARRDLEDDISQGLLRFFGVARRARAVLCPSGTDALLLASRLVAAETPGGRITAILPEPAETGTGVKLAATCRQFDGPNCGAALSDCRFDTVEIALRAPDGTPHPDAAIDAAFAAAASAADSRKLIILTHGSKTGLVAPRSVPAGVEVIVDACQGRLMPAAVAAYLDRGWPVVITGSKFFGGPAFSGAVLLPQIRFPHPPDQHPQLGTLLRWVVATEAMAAVAAQPTRMADRIACMARAAGRALAAMPWVVPVDGAETTGPGWGERASIFTFAVRDPAAPDRLLLPAELRPVYLALARRGVLVGQPVGIGRFGGLRIAVGANALAAAGDVPKLLSAIAACTDPARRAGRHPELALT